MKTKSLSQGLITVKGILIAAGMVLTSSSASALSSEKAANVHAIAAKACAQYEVFCNIQQIDLGQADARAVVKYLSAGADEIGTRRRTALDNKQLQPKEFVGSIQMELEIRTMATDLFF